MDVDPLKFRLRAFEHNFTKPITTYLERDTILELHAQATSFWQSLMAGAEEPELVSDHDAPASIGLTQACLLAEAAEWIRIGIEIGYFSSEVPPTPLRFGGIDLHENRRLFQFMSGRVPFVGLYEDTVESQGLFAKDLTAAAEQLDDADGRTELIRLLYFATPQEWARRFGMLGDLASTLERRPDASFSDGVIGELRWAFYEGSLTLSAYGPSSWRDTMLYTSLMRGVSEERLSQLTEVRSRIMFAAEKIGSGDESSASALLASLLQNNEGRGGPDRPDLPLLFNRLQEQSQLRSDQEIPWMWL